MIGLAAAQNDLLLTHQFLYPPTTPNRNRLSSGENFALLRLVLAQLWETHLLVSAADEHPKVAEFIDRLAQEYPGSLNGAELVSVLRGETGATVPELREVLRKSRNATHHYEKPGSARLTTALSSMTDEIASVSAGQKMHTVRADFADDVLLRVSLDLSEDELPQFMVAVSESVVAVIHLAQAAIALWFDDRGAEWETTAIPPPR